MNTDLTVIFLTVNKVPEHWRLYHREQLLKAIGRYPLITVSRVPMPDMPGTNLIQTEEICASNVYWQMLRAAKAAQTPYVAVAEDDSLYPPGHFTEFRPDFQTFSYNMHRWSLYEWHQNPFYAFRDRISNLTFIGPRDLTIQCLEERFAKYPNGTKDHETGELGKVRIERKLDLPSYKMIMWNSTDAVININHQYAMDEKEVRGVKKPGPLRAYDIPYWGKAADVLEHFK